MDAMDLNWCLTCNRHIDTEGTAPYCSPECFSSDRPSTSAVVQPFVYEPRAHPYSTADESSELDDDYDYSYPEPSCHSHSNHPYEQDALAVHGSAWIGKGAAGIHAWARAVKPGPPSECASISSTTSLRPPKLLLNYRRPVPPTLCMSKTIPAPAEPSRPILTPQQSLPSLLSHTDAASYLTPSSSVSLVTPDASDDGAPHAAQKSLMGALKAHFRAWAAPSGQNHCNRSPTLTRQSHRAIARPTRELPVCFSIEDDFVALGMDAKIFGSAQEQWDSSTYGITEKLGHVLEISRRPGRIEDHPALKARGRKASRGYS